MLIKLTKIQFDSATNEISESKILVNTGMIIKVEETPLYKIGEFSTIVLYNEKNTLLVKEQLSEIQKKSNRTF